MSRIEVVRSQFKVTVGSNMRENAFLALLTRYIENYWSDFRQLSAFMNFVTRMNASVFEVKGQRSRSQLDQRPIGQRHPDSRAQRCASKSNF